MNTFLVGGAVRDTLLGLDVKDRDWVVVGADIKTMLKAGYQQVGADFPVFLHPKTHEEYALARTERKSGQGYTGFVCDFAPDVTLEEDLQRRDLTINAIAQADDGTLVDPYGGKTDLDNKILRHVSPAFVEDPLRVLRVARFAARFHDLGFTVADDTMSLMRTIAESGELDALTPERVWIEWEKSLSTPRPDVFLRVLRDCGALAVVLPEIDALFGVPQPEQWHPEIDTGIHTLMVARQAATLTDDTCIRFAAQMHDLGKALTPQAEWPSHRMHTSTGKVPVKAVCDRVRVPNAYRDAALLVCAEHTNVHNAGELKASTYIKIFDRNDVWRKPERVTQLAVASQADHQGRTGFEDRPYPQADWLLGAFNAANSVEVKPIVAEGFTGQGIREELTRRRVVSVAKYLEEVRN
ncbi:multifunctional CCA tRNA nucleotidyl transferase/2'3'-cyclic phosphodiesterase/2'nucleotidase/phosphatase [Enterovibrio norvegicus]|uniref:multifunctional CCA addition/repair protein n=1 Tax=Enterovibrio norvegicus TaxID=188144 RepID=UPI000C817443|nr:multifunctional CCA addition/repair protein [Enterovibrio norvegicus]MCC4799051.1 multifunctional CCA addition/repair protein [Enterovibrio norvegicus]PMI41779.1 multifunctional CCA tRNA nucleotidyl transferase/2'3'-cyclic phosphodiesterase/2'nucleotidase/phosphatase [Enterovibrio norvegicus]PMN53861.1 multifunctional CCA tRNA nucleotidyl transferase/2'3'-cyclic phosphodiesterase/2'nucleotidase/phosphatase [Enterovibrio norvegicus]